MSYKLRKVGQGTFSSLSEDWKDYMEKIEPMGFTESLSSYKKRQEKARASAVQKANEAKQKNLDSINARADQQPIKEPPKNSLPELPPETADEQTLLTSTIDTEGNATTNMDNQDGQPTEQPTGDTTAEAMALTSSGNIAAGRMRTETPITPIPSYIQSRFPQSITWKFKTRRNFDATEVDGASSTLNDTMAFGDLQFHPLDPLRGLLTDSTTWYAGTPEDMVDGSVGASDSHPRTTTGPYAKSDLQYFDYFYNMYKNYCVLNSYIKLKIIDHGLIADTGTRVLIPLNLHSMIDDWPKLYHRDYGTVKPAYATVQAQNGQTLEEDPLMTFTPMHPDTARTEIKDGLRPILSATLEQGFNHNSYIRLTDIDGDSLDKLWIPTDGSNNPLPYRWCLYHRPFNWNGQSFTLTTNQNYRLYYEYEIGYEIQFKELKDAFNYGYYGNTAGIATITA